MKILLSGLCGHMGAEVINLINKSGGEFTLVSGVDAFAGEDTPVPCAKSFAAANPDCDCIIDFSHHSLTGELLKFAVRNRLPLVLATTAQTDGEKELIKAAAKEIPLFFAANYSLGVALLIDLAKKAAAVMGDAEIEIVEAHHNRKLDAPSGTALAIAEGIKEVRPDAYINCGRAGQGKRDKNEIGISSLRMGNVVGIHEVIIATDSQTITLKHEAHSRALFAEGALAAAKFLADKPAGLYDMKSILK